LVGWRRLTQTEKDDLKGELRWYVVQYLPMNRVSYSEDHVNVYDIEDMLKSTKNLKTDLANVITYISSMRS